MNWIYTPESSNVVCYGYDAKNEILSVNFTAGQYNYYGVPSTVFEDMKLADSKGQFLNKSVKPFFPFVKVAS